MCKHRDMSPSCKRGLVDVYTSISPWCKRGLVDVYTSISRWCKRGLVYTRRTDLSFFLKLSVIL